MTLGQKIRDMRKQMGISQEVLGEILNVSRQAITKWETDAGVPDVSNLSELAKLFGVSVDYFLTEKNNNEVTNQLDIDITKYKNDKEEDVQIIRHFYSEEWQANYLRYSVYPKNKFLRIILLILSLISDGILDALIFGDLVYSVDKFNDNYYLLTKEGLIFLAYINNNKLVVKNITNNIKLRKGTIFNNQNHFVYDNKMFSIFVKVKAEKMNNKKWFKTQVVFALVITLFLILLILLLAGISFI